MKKFLVFTLTLLMIFSLSVAVFATNEAVNDMSAPDSSVNDVIDSDAETETDEVKTKFGFYPETLLDTLPVMGMGMLGIFIVTAVIILAVVILKKFGNISKKSDKDEQ